MEGNNINFENIKEQLEQLLSDIFPCHKEHKFHKYFKGENSYYNCSKCPTNIESFMKCEMVASRLYEFIKELNEKESSKYTLVKCLDVPIKGQGNIPCQPEVELIDINNKKKMLIEVKSLHILDSNIKNEASLKELIGWLENCLMSLTDTKIINFFENNSCILYIDNEIRWKKNNKKVNFQAVYNEIIESVNTNFHIDKKIDILFKEYLRNINETKEKFSEEKFFKFCRNKIYSEYEFKVDGTNFTFGICNKEDEENGLKIRNRIRKPLCYDKNKVYKKIEEFLYESQEKFKNCDDYQSKRKVILIRNEGYYDDEKITNLIQKFQLPENIDEIWYSYYSTDINKHTYNRLI